ncbi:hypothetical protein L1987_87804 [Smallanthus sonchifolius]|nr:hypothetical protein L1987_87804 [Smallanthus sonchifolius]
MEISRGTRETKVSAGLTFWPSRYAKNIPFDLRGTRGTAGVTLFPLFPMVSRLSRYAKDECNISRGTRETPGIRPTILVLAVREDPVNILSRLIFVSGS